MKGILEYSIRQVNNLLQEGVLSSCELCRAALRRADHVKSLNAFITVSESVALSSAEQSTMRFKTASSKGLLDGIPIAVKDNFCTANIKTTCGSQMLESFVPKYTATVVQKLLDNGAVLVGKCNMDEFAMG